ncbi:hypothetical protein [Bradyrhizobium sp. STM 3566]|uniref:hypothetical protein n=1 Tax=Bradyrhizobium sp. STM 3566 TaxID=578928 RepID=UPI00388D9EC3
MDCLCGVKPSGLSAVFIGNRALKTPGTYLGRVARYIARKIDGDVWLKEMVLAPILHLGQARARSETA